MTREEAYKIDILTNTGFDTKIAVDKVYDYFENRTCESCNIYREGDDCVCKIIPTLIDITEFSCNKWDSVK